MKKGILRALIVVAAVASLASCAWISELFTPIEGTWTTTITYSSYRTFAATFMLARDGSTTANGSLTAASANSGAWPGTLPVSFTGTIDGTTMNLPIEMGYSDGTLSATDTGTFTASKS